MTWIKVILESEAVGELKKVYQRIRRQRSRDAEGPSFRPYMLHSLNPRVMGHVAALRDEIMGGDSGLTLVQREMIAVVTSQTLHCLF